MAVDRPKMNVREALEEAIKELIEAGQLLGEEGYFSRARGISDTVYWLQQALARQPIGLGQ